MKKIHIGKELNRQTKQGNSLLQAYAYKDKNDREVYYGINSICFSTLYSSKKDAYDEFYFSLIPAKRHIKHRKAFNSYVDYVLNRSSFKDCFHTRRTCDAWRYGIRMNTSVGLAIYLAAIVAIRTGYEYPWRSELFFYLRSKGVSEEIAYVMSNMFKKYKTYYIEEFLGSGHCLFGSNHFPYLNEFIMQGKDDYCKNRGYHFYETSRSMTFYKIEEKAIPISSKFNLPKKDIRKEWGDTIKIVKIQDIVKACKEWEELLKKERNE